LESQTLQTDNRKEKISQALENLRTSNPNFEHAFETYTQQYGRDAIVISEPLKLSGTVDPVVLILGRNCVICYYDSTTELKGSGGGLEIGPDTTCIIGRRQPQDSKLIGWIVGKNSEVELGDYNPRVGIIPSRVHGAIVSDPSGQAFYYDLGSSSGTIAIGDIPKVGPFVKIYDPGSPDFPAVKLERISMSRKT
jgi:hypothetical protein